MTRRYSDWYKMNEKDEIWWRDDLKYIGRPMFSFDRKRVHYVFGENLDKTLTEEEKAIFVRDAPVMAELAGLLPQQTYIPPQHIPH